jgi:uroporphyrinogen decarboxylase
VSEKPFLRTLQGGTSRVPPVWLMRQAGRYLPEYRALRAKAPDFLRFCLTPGLATEATLQPIRRFGLDAAILFADILIVPHALGQQVDFREGEGPVLGPLDKRQPGEVEGRVAPVWETVRRVAAALPKEVALIGFAGAPWTIATYMVEGGSSRDFARVKRRAFAEPEAFALLIDAIVGASVTYLSGQIEAGAEALQLFDSWAGVLPEAEFRRWVIEPTRRIVEALKARHPEVPIIGFPRGAGLLYEAYARESGVDAVSLDPTVPLGWAREHLQARLPVQGNLDPMLLVVGGAPMEQAVQRIREELGRGPLVFNLGHGILPETPPEHVAALVELVRR